MESITFEDFHIVHIKNNVEQTVGKYSRVFLYAGYYLYNFKTKRWYALDLSGSMLRKITGRGTQMARRYLQEIIEDEFSCPRNSVD